MLGAILGFFFFFGILLLAILFGAWCRFFFEWMEYERMPSRRARESFGSLISRILKYSIVIATLFVGIRYLLIPWSGVSEGWALLSLPMQFMIGWFLTHDLFQREIVEEGVSREFGYPNAGGRESVATEIRRPNAPQWRKSETRTIALPVSVQCFEKTPGGVFRPILDWSLDKGTVITIGPLETVLWDNNFHEVVPFSYNGYRYYLRVHDIKIVGLANQLRARSNLRVVK